tara:strand:+ start:687 stop:1361 length:675 start_codon:yes stop_codon:yes gene_type:complete
MENLTLVIPAKKEKESLPAVLDELKSYNLKIIIVVEKTDIETIESLKGYDVKILYQSGKGYGDALINGINSVDTEFFCIFNADGSFDPKELSFMLHKSSEENYDFVFGTRYEKDCSSDDDTFVTYVGNFIFTLLGKIFFKLKISDILYTYVLGKTSNAQNLNLQSKNFVFCVELPINASRNNYKITTSKSKERARIAGKKKVNAMLDGLSILSGMIRLFFNKNP